VQILICLDPGLLKSLDELARKKHISRAAAIRLILAERLAAE
jgi:hypothetical protein